MPDNCSIRHNEHLPEFLIISKKDQFMSSKTIKPTSLGITFAAKCLL
jgi:hypothetical protein